MVSLITAVPVVTEVSFLEVALLDQSEIAAGKIEAYRSMTDAEPFWTGETIEAGPVRFELIPGGAVAIVDDCVISYAPPLVSRKSAKS